MSFSRLYSRCLGGAGVLSSIYLFNHKEGDSEKFSLRAKEMDFGNPIFSYQPKRKWDANWDLRDPKSLVKEPGSNASDEDKEGYEKKLTEAKPKASRILVLVRHGQYNYDWSESATDADRYLTEMGKKQAEETGKRLAVLYEKYLDNMKDSECGKIHVTKSTMLRATQTADIILQQLPGVPHSSCDLLREGAPCMPEPPPTSWDVVPHEFFQEGAAIEAAFRKYFHRADPKQEKTSVDILVCHGNVIRYFICRALQFDPSGWLNMSLRNGSITILVIRPSGNVSLHEYANSGHFSPDLFTTN